MANEFDKIFGDTEPSENAETLDNADEIAEENSVPSSEPTVSARESYMQSIFGDDADKPSEFEEDYDPDAVYIKDKDGHFIKKEDEEETPEEAESQEDLLDEADELLESPHKKKVKKPVKKPEHKPEAVNTAIKRDIFETETEEEITSPSVNGVLNSETSVDTASVSPQIDDLDKGDNFYEEPKKEPKRAHSDDTARSYEPVSSTNDEFSEIERSNTDIDERSTTASRSRDGEKTISEMSREEIEQLTPEEISKLSPHEKRELLQKVDEYNVSEIQNDDVIERDTVPTPPVVSKAVESATDTHTSSDTVDSRSTETSNVPSSAFVDESIDESDYEYTSHLEESSTQEYAPKSEEHNTQANDVPTPAVVREDIDNADDLYAPNKESYNAEREKTPTPSSVYETPVPTPASSENADSTVGVHTSEEEHYAVPPVVYESIDSTAHKQAQDEEIHNAKEIETPTPPATYDGASSPVYTPAPNTNDSVAELNKNAPASAVHENTDNSGYTPIPNVENSSHSGYTPNAVKDVVNNAAEHSSEETTSPTVAYYGNRTETDRPRQEFNTESFKQDLQHYTGYDINVTDKGDSFEVYTPNQTFTLDKTSGNVVGEAGALSAIVGKTYEQYSPAPITSPQSSAKEETIPLKPPERVDTWSPEKVISGFDGRYGEVTASTNENGHTVLTFPEQRGSSSFSVELNNQHQPVSINNPPPFVKDVVDNIYQQNQSIAATDNAEYIRQKTIYRDAVKAQENNAHRNTSVPIYTSAGFNPNGTSTKIGDGYNLANNSQSPVSAHTHSFANPYLSDKMHPSVMAGYRTAFANFDKSTFIGYGPANSYVKDIYQDFVKFRENLSSDKNYVDTAYSEAKTTVYNAENSKSAPFSFSGFSGTYNEVAYSPTPFNYGDINKRSVDSAVDNIQTYGSAINPIYNIKGFSQYRFLQETKQAVGRATQSIGRPLLNTIKSTASSTEIGQGARQMTGYLAAPFLIGAYAAYKNIWRQTNSQEMLRRTSEKARYVITNRLNSSGVFFKSSHSLDSINGINRVQRGIAHRGKELGLNNIGKMKYADLQTLKSALHHRTIMYQGKKINLASAKSIFRHLGDKAPEEIKLWVEQYRLVDSAIAFQKYLDAASEHFINELKGLGLIKADETFDLMNLRDVQMLQRRLSKYAENRGYDKLSGMSTKKLLEWIQKHQGEESAVIAEKLVFLKKYQKRARRMGNMKYTRLFAILRLIQTVMKDNDVVSGGLMMYRTVHSAIMATKATIRLIKTSARFLGFVGRKLGRFAIKVHLDVPAKAVGKVLRGTGRAVGRAVSHTRTGVRVAHSVHSIKSSTLAQRTLSAHKKFKAGSSLRKAKFKKFVTGKPKILTKLADSFAKSAMGKAFSAISKALGQIFLGAVIGVAIVFGVTALASLACQGVVLLYDKVTAFTESFETIFGGETELQKLYGDLEAQDEAFMKDMQKAGKADLPDGLYGYRDLSEFDGSDFPFATVKKPGIKGADPDTLWGLGYEYHLYDRMIEAGQKPKDIGAVEIPFESNAKEIISCGNVIFYTDSTKKDIVILNDKGKAQNVSYKEALKDYALKGEHFKDADKTPRPLWTATHGFFTQPSDKYACGGCATYKYQCCYYPWDYKAAYDSSYGKHVGQNDENIRFYDLVDNKDKSIQYQSSKLVPQTKHGCKQHNMNTTTNSGAVDYVYYCGLRHNDGKGNCYVCNEANAKKYNKINNKFLGHTQTVKKIKDCKEQYFKYVDKNMTFVDETKDSKIASYCDFVSPYNEIKKNMPNSLASIGIHPDNIYSFSKQINDRKGNAISGLKLNGWVYVTGEVNGADVSAVKSYLQKNVCKNCKSTYETVKIWYSDFDYMNVYCYIFYCGGKTGCSHNVSGYDTKTLDYTFTLTDADNTKYPIEYKNLSLSYQCNQITRKNVTKTVQIPHFECLGYCNGHEIGYCKGHYNNVVTGYIVKSMDHTFAIECTNPKCSLYGVLQKNVTNNVCQGILKDKSDRCERYCPIKLPNLTTIFYADSRYGPTSLDRMPAWGKDNINVDPTHRWSTLGWYDTFKGTSRVSSAVSKSLGDWNNLYGISSVSEVNSSRLSSSETKQLLELNQYGSLNNGKERKAFVLFALNSTGKVPYYEGGFANLGYDGNNFGTAVSKDTRGRTLKGLDNKSWIIWAYASAKDDMTYLNRSINDSACTSSRLFQAGDIIKLKDGTYGVFVGMSGSNICVVQEFGEPLNNVAVKYYSDVEGYIPYEQALK